MQKWKGHEPVVTTFYVDLSRLSALVEGFLNGLLRGRWPLGGCNISLGLASAKALARFEIGIHQGASDPLRNAVEEEGEGTATLPEISS